MAIKFNESAAKKAQEKEQVPATKFVNEAGVPLSFNLPDKKHILLPGEEIVFNPSPMSKKEMDGVVKKREQRKEYKRERSVELMRELREAKRLGINVADYRKQLKGD